MRNRGDVFDQFDLQPRRLQCGDGTFSTGSWSFDPNLDVAHPKFGRFLGGLLGGTLAGKRSAFATALEPAGTGTCPAQRVTLDIGDRHRGVVERRVNMGDAVGHVAPYAFLFIALCHCKVLKLQTDNGLVSL